MAVPRRTGVSERPHHPAAPAPWSRRMARLAFAAALLALGAWVARGFLGAVTWAIVIAVAVWPLHRRLAGWMPGAVLAPLLSTVLASLLVLLPLSVVAVEVVREAQMVTGWLAEAQEKGVPVPEWVERLPLVGQQALGWWKANLSDPNAAGGLLKSFDTNALAGWSSSLGGEVLHRLLLFFVTLVALFGLFREGAWLARRCLDAADRWLGDPGERLAGRMAAAVRGTAIGTLVVAVGEGVVIGIGYWVAGVPHPVLFGVITAACAMLPLGAWLAFAVASLILLARGDSVAAAALFGFGAAVMLAGDNFVQPALIGGAVRLPFPWALVGILGGLQTFGLLGLVLGPVVMAAILMLWRDWGDVAPPKPEA
ncbi:AI-2E family transporter [Azospirillum sp. TSO22-1]|uniref:AI-2E family transporter n=1 Tax=Azospirillum sp. TSO22-1 TaxID=716789 RepID=UPI000D653335|nr:AI-2E family transporter [Azospirillum sp. TSO22-1]